MGLEIIQKAISGRALSTWMPPALASFDQAPPR